MPQSTRSPLSFTLNARRRAVSVAIGLALTGCAGGGSDTPPPTPGPGDPGARVTPAGVAGPSANASVGAARNTPAAGGAAQPVASNVPRDAKYTIECMGFNGPAHVQQAKVSKDNVVSGTGRPDFYVVHDDARSTLYYGYYREMSRAVDPREAARVATDLEYVRSLGDAEGHRFFAKSLVVPLPTPEPPAPAEFDLTKLDQDKSPDDPSRRFWTLAIADFTNDIIQTGVSRKQAAVDAVILARQMGYEAYFYNGPNTSTICIGSWPRRAVREQEASQAETKADNGQDLLVSSGELPKEMTDELQSNGRNMKIMQPKVEVDDPTLLSVASQFRDKYSVNGNIEQNRVTDPTTGKTTLKAKQPFLVQIPRVAAPSLLAGDRLINGGGDNVGQSNSPTLVNPLAPGGGTSGAGRLRSVTP